MGTIRIEARNFNKQLSEIKRISKTSPAAVQLTTFQTKGKIIGWNQHKVTGEEANLLVSDVQSGFIQVNQLIHALYKQFSTIYSTFDQLDKEYISGILAALNSSEIASNQAKEASVKAIDAQKDIARTIEGLKVTVQKLKDFKEATALQLTSMNNQINSLVDAGSLQSFKSTLENLQEQLRELNLQVKETSKQTVKSVEALQSYCFELQSYEHLADIDGLWNDVARHDKENVKLRNDLEIQMENVNNSIVQTNSGLVTLQQSHTQLDTFCKQLEQRTLVFSSKLKKAYAIAVVAATISIAQLVLNLIGIL